MFICQVSGRVSKPREKSYRVVVETRPKSYFREMKDGTKKKVGEGHEIVRELVVCEKVYLDMSKGKQNAE